MTSRPLPPTSARSAGCPGLSAASIPIREFLKQHSRATVVNLGCGLDTTFERIDDGRVDWYDLDLPDVIELRKKFIQESARHRMLACSLLDDAWLKELKTGGSNLFVAMGVFYYLRESEVKAFLIKLADTFPGCEVLFDACSALGRKMANDKVIKAGGMDQSAILQWDIERAQDVQAWDRRIAVVGEYRLFRKMKYGFTLKEKWGTFLSDLLRVMLMVHLRLGEVRRSLTVAAP